MSIVPYSENRESQELVRAYACPTNGEPLAHAVTLIPCCHKINQAAAEVIYGRMVGEHCEHQGRPCVVCKAPVIAYYADPIVRDLVRRTLRLAESIEAHALARPLPEPRVLPAIRAAEGEEPRALPAGRELPVPRALPPSRVIPALIAGEADELRALPAGRERLAEEIDDAPRIVVPRAAVEVAPRRVEDEAARQVAIIEIKKEALVAARLLGNTSLYNTLKESGLCFYKLAEDLDRFICSRTNMQWSFPAKESGLWDIQNFVLYGIAQQFFQNKQQIIPNISERLKDNEAFMLKAIYHSGEIFQYGSPRIKDNDAVVLAAVKRDADNLKFTSPRLQDNEVVVTEALKSKSSTSQASPIQFASLRLRDSEAIMLAAGQTSLFKRQYQTILYYASERLKASEAFMVEFLKVCSLGDMFVQ